MPFACALHQKPSVVPRGRIVHAAVVKSTPPFRQVRFRSVETYSSKKKHVTMLGVTQKSLHDASIPKMEVNETGASDNAVVDVECRHKIKA